MVRPCRVHRRIWRAIWKALKMVHGERHVGIVHVSQAEIIYVRDFQIATFIKYRQTV